VQRAWQLFRIGESLDRRADTAVILGHTQFALQHWDDATASYQDAITCYERLGNPTLAVEAQAGLAAIALAQGEPAQAQPWIERMLPIMADQALSGFAAPISVYLSAYHTLAIVQDARADALLQQAHTLLQTYASHIHDEPLRQSFLQKVPAHRQVQQLYAAKFALPIALGRSAAPSTAQST